eukprot:5410061-Alexandrium_andersonii.AAC.1
MWPPKPPSPPAKRPRGRHIPPRYGIVVPPPGYDGWQAGYIIFAFLRPQATISVSSAQFGCVCV